MSCLLVGVARLGAFDDQETLMLVPISDEDRKRLRGLAWASLRKLAVAGAAAAGSELGKRTARRICDWIFGDEDDGEDGDE